MNYANIKLIATDMDGTLLDSNHQINELFLPTFKKLQDHGVIFSVASGRQLYNLQKQVSEVSESTYFIAENGSFMVYQDQELLVEALDKEKTREFVQIGRNIPDSYLIICGKKKAYVENDDPEFLKELTLYFERFELVDDLLKVEDDEFLKFTIANLNGTEEFVYPFFQHLNETCQVKISGKIWLDISHKLANKGRAIQVLQEKFGITRDETMVFGDFLNDLEMLEQATYSFAMKNAHPEVIETANYLAAGNDENGVVSILQEVVAAMDEAAKKSIVTI